METFCFNASTPTFGGASPYPCTLRLWAPSRTPDALPEERTLITHVGTDIDQRSVSSALGKQTRRGAMRRACNSHSEPWWVVDTSKDDQTASEWIGRSLWQVTPRDYLPACCISDNFL